MSSMCWLAVIMLVVSYVVCRGIVQAAGSGRSLVAIRDNETAAAVMGVNLVRTKTLDVRHLRIDRRRRRLACP